MPPHSFANLLSLAHTDAVQTRRVLTIDPDAETLLRIALLGPRAATFQERLALRHQTSTAATVGTELYWGRTKHPLTRKLRNQLKRMLAQDIQFFLFAVDSLGYQPPLLRAGLEHHFDALVGAPITSDAYLVGVDLRTAIGALDRASSESKMLRGIVAGFSPAEVATALGVDGAKTLGQALQLLSNYLEGRSGENHNLQRPGMSASAKA